MIERADHVRLIEARGGVHLVAEVGGEFGVGRVVADRELDRDRRVRRQMDRPPDLTHPAPRDRSEELESGSQAQSHARRIVDRA